MTSIPYVSEDYECHSAEEALLCLAENGVAILPDILTPEECTDFHRGVWEGMEHITADFETPLRRDDPTTWSQFWKLSPKHSMLLQQWQVGHLQAVWDIRQNPKVVQTFAELWDVEQEDLITSMDGISLHLPSEQTGRGWARPNKNALHCDQGFTNSQLQTIQGWVTALDVNDGDATLTFLRGSHHHHARLAEQFRDPLLTDRKNWNILTPEMIQYCTEECGCPQECIQCPAGSLVLWDSRTIHCGREPSKGREESNERCIAYVCMAPRAKATERMLVKRRKAFAERRMTGHHPYVPILFPKHPRTYGEPLPKVRDVPEPQLTDIGESLLA